MYTESELNFKKMFHKGIHNQEVIMKHKVCHFQDSTPVAFEEPRRTSYVQLTTKDGVSLGIGGCEVPPHSSNQNHVHDAAEVMHVIEGQLEFCLLYTSRCV